MQCALTLRIRLITARHSIYHLKVILLIKVSFLDIHLFCEAYFLEVFICDN